MKHQLVFAFLIILIFNRASAQWYSTHCGAPDLETLDRKQYECLWLKAQQPYKAGMIITLVGSAAVLGGGITMLASDPCCSSGNFLIGTMTFLSGIAVDIIGIPIWIVGSHRKSELRKSSWYQEVSGSKIKIKPWIAMDGSTVKAIPGISIRFSF